MRGWPWPAPDDSRPAALVRSELEEEIDHHQSALEERLLACGLAPAEARAEAARRLGDRERHVRACLRIHYGRTLMQRNALMVGAALLGLVGLGFGWTQHRNARIATALEREARVQMEAARAEWMRAAGASWDADPHLRPGDRVEVQDNVQPTLNGTFAVSSDGAILLPGLGRVEVGGLSREELEVHLRKTVEAYFADSDLSVRVFRGHLADD